ncbi:type II toxin-antitoxin system VapC family toxin [Tianweitania sp.]|uniref:type II toxin-antitoxin system VapC family toxin n=1 Tax=Tianweitania sp. TaxID=2021634 RepID=UPI0028995A79|nr:type II toxin-antitoxin system VapC family toxin [Tianweitania sp.]
MDTNVVSALMKPGDHPAIAHWLNQQPHLLIRTTSITIMEITYGIERMPLGRKRRDLEERFATLRSAYLQDVLAFDKEAAVFTATILAQAHSTGRNLDFPDTQIAGIVLANNATLATRNIRDFEGLGLKLVNPWD